jgi:2,5-furandicarboxylate decarboxylase 1
MTAHNFRSFVKLLEDRGDLVRIRKAVDRRFELTALTRELDTLKKAVVFENVEGSQMPVISGLYTGLDRFGLALGAASEEPFTIPDHRARFLAAMRKPVPIQRVDSGPVREVVKTGQAIELSELPVPTFFERDSGAFITGAVGISRHPETGELNVGIYRALILDGNTITVNASSMSDLYRIYEAAQGRGEAMPIALAIGVDPALMMAAASKPPPGVSEYDVAGALKGEAIEVVQCESSDLVVPANAEIVIEGRLDFNEAWVGNTLAEFPNLYGPATSPVVRVTAVTHRHDAMFYSIMAGFNNEHSSIGGIAVYHMQGMLESAAAKLSPNIKRVRVIRNPRLTGPMMHMVISLDKKDDEEPGKLIQAAFAAEVGSQPLSRMFRRVVIVDDDIDVDDITDVEWAIWTRVGNPSRFVLIPDVLGWELDRVADDELKSLRVGIDATMALADVGKLVRPAIPGASKIHIEDYIELGDELSLAGSRKHG